MLELGRPPSTSELEERERERERLTTSKVESVTTLSIGRLVGVI